MTFREIILSIEGLNDRDILHEEWLRRTTVIIAGTNFGGKGVAGRMDKLWPSRVRKERDNVSAAKRALENHRKYLETQNRKNAGRT